MDRVIKNIFDENHDIYFAEDVDEVSLARIIKEIREITNKDEKIINDNKALLESIGINISSIKYPPINIYLSTYGGVVYDGLGIYDAIKSVEDKYEVNVIVTGKAMSCGLFILQAGTKRYGTKNSTYLYHDVSDVEIGKIKAIQESTEEGLRLRNRIHDIILTRTKISEQQLNDSIEHKKDWYFDAQTALELGVIDEIIN